MTLLSKVLEPLLQNLIDALVDSEIWWFTINGVGIFVTKHILITRGRCKLPVKEDRDFHIGVWNQVPKWVFPIVTERNPSIVAPRFQNVTAQVYVAAGLRFGAFLDVYQFDWPGPNRRSSDQLRRDAPQALWIVLGILRRHGDRTVSHQR